MSFLFGGGKDPAPATVQTVSQTSEFPTEVKPFISDVLEKAQAQQEGREFEKFEGPRIAGFTPEQEQAFSGIGGIAQAGLGAYPDLASSAFYATQAQQAAEEGLRGFDIDQAQRLMDPFQQAVTDIEKREAIRQFEGTTLPQIGAQAVGAGGFGGSRQAILEGEAQRNLQQQLGDIQAKGLRDAYQTAGRQFEAERARQQAGAGQFGQFAQAFPGQALKELGAVQAVGETKETKDQRALDIALSDFLTEQEFPTRQLQEYQSLIRGFPISPNIFREDVTSVPSPPLSQQLLGLAGTGIQAASLGNLFGAGGGRVGSLPVRMQSGGQIRGGLSSLERHQDILPVDYVPTTVDELTTAIIPTQFSYGAQGPKPFDFKEAAKILKGSGVEDSVSENILRTIQGFPEDQRRDQFSKQLEVMKNSGGLESVLPSARFSRQGDDTERDKEIQLNRLMQEIQLNNLKSGYIKAYEDKKARLRPQESDYIKAYDDPERDFADAWAETAGYLPSQGPSLQDKSPPSDLTEAATLLSGASGSVYLDEARVGAKKLMEKQQDIAEQKSKLSKSFGERMLELSGKQIQAAETNFNRSNKLLENEEISFNNLMEERRDVTTDIYNKGLERINRIKDEQQKEISKDLHNNMFGFIGTVLAEQVDDPRGLVAGMASASARIFPEYANRKIKLNKENRDLVKEIETLSGAADAEFAKQNLTTAELAHRESSRLKREMTTLTNDLENKRVTFETQGERDAYMGRIDALDAKSAGLNAVSTFITTNVRVGEIELNNFNKQLDRLVEAGKLDTETFKLNMDFQKNSALTSAERSLMMDGMSSVFGKDMSSDGQGGWVFLPSAGSAVGRYLQDFQYAVSAAKKEYMAGTVPASGVTIPMPEGSVVESITAEPGTLNIGHIWGQLHGTMEQ